jgi:hypothetical protein
MVTVSTMLMAVIDKRILVPMQVVLLHDAVSEESQSTVGGGGGLWMRFFAKLVSVPLGEVPDFTGKGCV